jgi:hypothetical protein
VSNQGGYRGKRMWWRLLDGQGRTGQRGRVRLSRPLPLAGRKPPHVQAGWQGRQAANRRRSGHKVRVWLCLVAILVLVILAYTA